MNADDWEAEMRERLQQGEVTPIPHDPEWWAAWERRINEAPAWQNTNEHTPSDD